MTTLATAAYEKRIEKNIHVTAEHGVSWFEPKGGERYKRGDWEKKQLFVDVPNPEQKYICERITSKIWEIRRKPFADLFRGTKEIVFAGREDPLKSWRLVAEIIQTLRKQGWKGKISMETTVEIEKLGGICMQPPFHAGYRDSRTGDIVRELTCIGLNKISIFTMLRLPPGTNPRHELYKAGIPEEIVRFVESCMRYRLDTYVHIGLLDEHLDNYWKWKKCMFNAVRFTGGYYPSSSKSELITLKPSHVSLERGYLLPFEDTKETKK